VMGSKNLGGGMYGRRGEGGEDGEGEE
jgi:hypothetical protein